LTRTTEARAGFGKAEERAGSDGAFACRTQDRGEGVELHHREELMWKQRARIEWLRSGDKNTRFFHLRASMRRRKNLVVKLKKSDGQLTEDPGEMVTMVTNFYKTLYMTEGIENMEAVLTTVPVKVSVEMNNQLLAAIKVSEAKEALFQMFPTKAPGPDGYLAHFFRKH